MAPTSEGGPAVAGEAMSSLDQLPVFAKSPAAGVRVGLIGSGIQASLSPAMHMREGRAIGLVYDYRLIDLEQLGMPAGRLPDLVAAAERAGFAGLNITHPCKQAVLQHLDDLSREARELGAVNTVVFRDGKRIGRNTDWWGFAEAFRRDLGGVPHRRVVQLGAGGAGAAVAHALLKSGVSDLRIVDTEMAKAEALCSALALRFAPARVRAVSDARAALAGTDGLVNTSPVGMDKYPGTPVPADALRRDIWVADIIYFPIETELLRRAREAGCRTMNGGGMAVFQAVAAFEHFSGRKADAARMQAHFAELIRAQK